MVYPIIGGYGNINITYFNPYDVIIWRGAWGSTGFT